MIQNHQEHSPATPALRRTASRKYIVLCHLLILAVLTACLPAQADEQDDAYLAIVESIQRADALAAKGQTAAALAKYKEAQATLERFARANRDWNKTMVAYRLKYLGEKIDASSEKPAANENQGTATQSAPSATPAAGHVKLISSGSEPRKVLRLHPKVGDKQSVVMKMKMGTEMKMAGMDSPAVKLPGMVLSMDVTVQDVSAEGDIKYETVMTDASVESDPGVIPQAAEMMKTSLAQLKGTSQTETVTSQGVDKSADTSTTAGTNPQMQQVIGQMKQSSDAISVQLPDDAVGPGAKWEIKKQVKSQGITLEQTTGFELVSIDGEQIVAKTVITQTASHQKIESPAMPGLKVDLNKLTAKGTGELTLDLNHLMPQKATVDTHSEMSMGMNIAGQKQAMGMNLDITMQLECK